MDLVCECACAHPRGESRPVLHAEARRNGACVTAEL